MKILMITGPSGSGKDFVQERMSADIFSEGIQISFDKLFEKSVYRAFPFYTGRQYNHPIWNANIDQEIDFASVFRASLLSDSEICFKNVLIQGVQLRKHIWRQAILAAINATELDQKHLLAIHPKPETLLTQRVESKKDWHQQVANSEKCKTTLKHFEKDYKEQPPEFGEIEFCDTKESALQSAIRFYG